MKQYIDKAAVFAEIERRIKKYATIDVGDSRELDALYGAKYKALMEILSFLDSFEVKEVNLEKEFDKCCEDYIFDDEWDVYTARHFFKLGFQKAQKGE